MRQRRLSVSNWSALSIHEFPTMANGRWMLQQIVMHLAICYIVCPFQMMVQCVVIRREADCAFFLHFMSLERSCLPTSNACILSVHRVQNKCFHSSFDCVSYLRSLARLLKEFPCLWASTISRFP